MGIYYNRRAMIDRRQELRRHPTLPEKVLWSQLRGSAVSGIKFRRQYSVGSYIVDFYAPSLHLAVEVDGEAHAEPSAIEYDAARTRFLEEFRIMVLRFSNEEVMQHCDRVIARIEEVVVERSMGWGDSRGTTPYPPP